DPWSEPETLLQEKETLGFYVSSHPLDQWASWISAFKCTPTNELGQVEQKGRALVGGMIQSVRPIVIRNGKSAGQKMAILTFEDRVGSIDAVLFSDQYAIFAADLKPDEMLFLIGDVDHSRGDPQLIVDRVIPIDGMPRHPIRWLDVLFDATVHDDIERRLLEVHALLRQSRGKEPVPLRAFVYFEGAARPVPIPAPNWACTPTPDLMKRLHDLLGPDGYAITGPVLRRDSDRKLGKVRMRRS
ncbi:MAG: hypothetical protein KDA28_16695, partial [Phycisphaerales bacterium]|nr:hypothetical protein [Phycisphaerales bacterium]